MQKDYTSDRDYLEHKFVDEAFYDGCSGLPMAQLLDGLTEQFERDKALPRPIAKARAFAFVLENMQIRVSNHDYFPAMAACMVKPVDKIYKSRWRTDVWDSVFTKGELDEINKCDAIRLTRITSDFEHCVPDWDAVLSRGFSGLLKRAEQYAKSNEPKFAEHPEKAVFYDAIRIEFEAILHLLDRLITEAEQLPLQPKGEQIVSALRQLKNGHAGTFYEALLQIWLYFQLSEYVDGIQTRSLGNLDRVLYPYYCEDLASGRCTEADIRKFINAFMYQLTAMHYTVGHPFYFGGTNADGSSTINELSFLILDEYDRMGIFDPKLQIKVSPHAPKAFVDKALDMIRRGRNSIAFVGETCIERTMLRYGYTLREAQTADIKGCYEYCARGGTVETAPVTVNAVKILGLALHNGVEPLSGQQLGLKTGTLEELTSFGKLYRAFLKQLFYRFDRYIDYALRMEERLDDINPAPMLSSTFENSLKLAVDGYSRGAKYNNSNLWIAGPATTADSLTMIKRYVFDRKMLTLPELVKMLDEDFKGNEAWRCRLLNDPEKFGNNLDLPDRIARHFASAVARRYNGRPNSRGGFFTTSLHSSNRFIQWAPMVEASADGRRRNDEFSKNLTASQGASLNGATAQVASVLKFDSSLFMADFPVDIMLHPSAVKGESGLAAMRALLMTYVKNYGHAMHFNVMAPEILRKAQVEPEKYRDLQVRICGWNVLWNSLPKYEQDAYIRQAEKL